MGHTADAGRAKVDLAWISLSMGDEFGDRPGRKRGVYHQDIRPPRDARNRRNIADEVETKPVVQRRVDGVRRTAEQERVTVCRRARHGLGAQISACTSAIFNNEWLPKPIRQALTDQTRENVEGAARAEAHNDTHRPRRVGLRSCDMRSEGQRRSRRGKAQKLPTGKHHGSPPSATELLRDETRIAFSLYSIHNQ